MTVNRYELSTSKNITCYGSLIHYCLSKIYDFAMDSSGVVPSEIAIRSWVNEFKRVHPIEFRNLQIPERELICGVAFVILCEYVKFYNEDFKVKKWEEVEKVSESTYFGTKLRRKVDGKFRLRGKKWLLETKTMSRIELNSLLLRLTFDFQNLFYITCEEVNEPNDPVEGVLYNIIRNPCAAPKAGEQLHDFLQRLRDAVKKDPKHYFLRYEIPYTQEDKIKFRQDLQLQLEEMRHVIVGIMPVYKNPFACTGRFTCEFLNACSSGKMSGYTKRITLFPELEMEE